MMEDLVARRTAADLGGRAGLASDANHATAEWGGGSEVGRRWWRRRETAMEVAAMTAD